MRDQVQEIKERLNIVEVVGAYVKLTKAGKNYKGLSPFRKEKTPSFFVSPDKGMYYDFSSGQGGDIFTFVQKMEGLDFKGALHLLAERAGVALVREKPETKNARERLYTLLEESCRFFETKLSEHSDAMAYIEARGITQATARMFRLGFAPDDWRALHTHLSTLHFTDEEMEQAGMCKKNENGNVYDRFRSRIVFPIHDAAGRVIGFSGRVFGRAAHDEKNPKYLNSPETPLFDKSRVLYGYDKAKYHIRKYDFSILVEGQMDIVMSHQAGYANTIAVSGTGLTEHHLALIDRLSKKLVLAFDADSAGIASTARAAILALGKGMDVKVVQVPVGKDPADCIKEDVSQWKEAVKRAQHVIDFFLERAINENDARSGDERALNIAVRDTVLPYLTQLQSGVEKAYFVKKIAQTLNIAEEGVWQDVRKKEHKQSAGSQYQSEVPVHKQGERSAHDRTAELERTISGFIFWQGGKDAPIISEEELVSLSEQYGVPIETLLAKHSEEQDVLAYQIELLYGNEQNLREVFTSLMTELAKEILKKQQIEISEHLRKAEREKNDVKAHEYLQQFQEIAKKIAGLE